MGKRRLLKASGDYVRGFQTEDGVHYRTESQNLDPAIRRVRDIRHMHEGSTRASNPNGWQHVGSVPTTVLIDWLNTHGYTIDQWARNDGGNPYKTDMVNGGGVKDKFLKYFMSRDFCKLHNNHVTTKRESSQIVVPEHVSRSLDNGDKQPK